MVKLCYIQIITYALELSTVNEKDWNRLQRGEMKFLIMLRNKKTELELLI